MLSFASRTFKLLEIFAANYILVEEPVNLTSLSFYTQISKQIELQLQIISVSLLKD
jgi:hypothetical protein